MLLITGLTSGADYSEIIPETGSSSRIADIGVTPASSTWGIVSGLGSALARTFGCNRRRVAGVSSGSRNSAQDHLADPLMQNALIQDEVQQEMLDFHAGEVVPNRGRMQVTVRLMSGASLGQFNLDPNISLARQLRERLGVNGPNLPWYKLTLGKDILQENQILAGSELGDLSNITAVAIPDPIAEFLRIPLIAAITNGTDWWESALNLVNNQIEGARQGTLGIVLPELERFRDLLAPSTTQPPETFEDRLGTWVANLAIDKPEVLKFMMKVINFCDFGARESLAHIFVEVFNTFRLSLSLKDVEQGNQGKLGILDEIFTFLEEFGLRPNLYCLNRVIGAEYLIRRQVMIRNYLELFRKHPKIQGKTALIIIHLGRISSFEGDPNISKRLLKALIAKEPDSISGYVGDIPPWSKYFRDLNPTQQTAFLKQIAGPRQVEIGERLRPV